MTEIPMVLEINCTTGEETIRPLTDKEIAQREIDAAQAEQERIDANKKMQAKADAKLAAQAKLQALGLTGEEIAAITE